MLAPRRPSATDEGHLARRWIISWRRAFVSLHGASPVSPAWPPLVETMIKFVLAAMLSVAPIAARARQYACAQNPSGTTAEQQAGRDVENSAIMLALEVMQKCGDDLACRINAIRTALSDVEFDCFQAGLVAGTLGAERPIQ